MFKKVLGIGSVLLLTLLLAVGCGGQTTEPKEDVTIKLATTTSTQDSGLLDVLLPEFTKDTGIKVDVLAQGTGQALKTAESGDADALLVHAKAKEEAFIEAGFGTKREELMYNDFIIVGPKSDPLSLKQNAGADAKKALTIIADSKTTPFISRGDESGTDTKEKGIWKAASINPEGDWYISAGKGMAPVLEMASETQAYTLTDRATFLALQDQLDLEIVTEKDPTLYNQYAIVQLNYEKLGIPEAQANAANEWIDWMFSEKAINMIKDFGVAEYGQSLFIPNPSR